MIYVLYLELASSRLDITLETLLAVGKFLHILVLPVSWVFTNGISIPLGVKQIESIALEHGEETT